ncbi:hypothetical protein SAMN02910297_01406 [Methanobrevibacter olleyae]|uniref:Uncharacterized protein n=1 Tax=Methanobrevibacter olleyae TaxID=294671 RepID=A0A1I4JCI3_METOL|nr:hypothetical protein [Methanobrevibacter olleyae]SFL64288.1 hypothetical protein SAMN02910297_01406 [Methanobrevibacter olleyae]
MSKSTKSRNTTLKKVKKLERQGKYLKALKVCDEYLDNTIAEESLILLKIDILVEYYNNDDFIGLINEYKIKLTNFLEEDKEIELLKIYNTLDNYLELKTQNLATEGIVKSYLAGGLLIDNLETILVLNEMVKDNYKNLEEDEEYIEKTMIPQDLENFVENVLKTSYQYLELILTNPKAQIADSNFNLDAIRSKLIQFLKPKKEEPEEKIVKSAEKITIETVAELESESEKELLKSNDDTEISREYSTEDEIQGLKDIISYLNNKNEFKKALIYQRKLVKLAREENIKFKEETDSKQRTLSDF